MEFFKLLGNPIVSAAEAGHLAIAEGDSEVLYNRKTLLAIGVAALAFITYKHLSVSQ